MASARPKTEFDDKRSHDSNANGHGSGDNSQKNKNQNQQSQKAARRKYNQNRKGHKVGNLGAQPHLPERSDVKMPEPSPPNESELSNALNTPPPAKIEKLSDEQDAYDTTNENFVTANNSSAESFTMSPAPVVTKNGHGDGDKSNEIEKTPSRFQPRDPETDDRNGNFVFGSPTLHQDESFKFTGDTSELEANSSAVAQTQDEEEDEDENEHVTHASLLVNLSDSTAHTPSFNVQSFTSSSSGSANNSTITLSSDSPVSTKSAPPDLSTVANDFSEDEFPALAGTSVQKSSADPPAPLQTSTPFLAEAVRKVNHDVSLTPPTGNPKKKNSVSFAEVENIIPHPDTSKYADEEASNESSEEEDSQALGQRPPARTFVESVAHAREEDRKTEAEAQRQDTEIFKAEAVAQKASHDVDIGSSEVEHDDDAEADDEVSEINSILPATVTELTANNGVKVYLIGTAHFSKESQMDCIRTIQQVQPSLVVLELCHARRNILQMDEETILREAENLNFEKMRAAIRQSGVIPGVLHLLLLSMSASITKQLGMAPGGEFRVAFREAQKIQGCMCLLGDRAIDITLSRALASLSFFQKLRLGIFVLFGNDKITKEEVEACKEKDLLEKMLCDMSGQFPTISRVFVDERDKYLSHTIWLAALGDGPRSRFGEPMNGPVVGIVGLGHVPGIIKCWGKVTEEEIAEIVRIPEPTLTSIVIGKSIKFSFYLLLTYGAYKCSKKLFNFPSDQFIQSTVNRVLPPIESLSAKLWPKRM